MSTPTTPADEPRTLQQVEPGATPSTPTGVKKHYKGAKGLQPAYYEKAFVFEFMLMLLSRNDPANVGLGEVFLVDMSTPRPKPRMPCMKDNTIIWMKVQPQFRPDVDVDVYYYMRKTL
ncbi:uncharacterized protein LOC144880642 isoform X1 [Branchiostoma floridae x Branchiostoma japonicum]